MLVFSLISCLLLVFLLLFRAGKNAQYSSGVYAQISNNRICTCEGFMYSVHISYDLWSGSLVHRRIIYCLLYFFWFDFFPFCSYCLQGTNVVALTYISFTTFSSIKSLIMTCKPTDVMFLSQSVGLAPPS